MKTGHQVIQSPEALIKLASEFAQEIKTHSHLNHAPIIIYLLGELGAGKTTFSKGFLKGFGYQGLVKSPTYTLVEPYDMGNIKIYHFDLYRLTGPNEAEELGITDYFHENSISLIEWPEKAQGFLPPCHWQVNIEFQENNLHRFINIKNVNEDD